jgi:cell shape-determining protein MreD
MNWLALALAAWIFLALELSLKAGLALGDSTIAPSFLFVLLTLIAMSASPRASTWTALALGLAMDLTFEIPLKAGGPPATVVGPYALSYVLGVQLILALRGVMIRRNPLTLGFLAMVGLAVAQVTLVAIFSVRAFYDPIFWEPARELWVRLLSCVYTGIVGAIFGLVLIPLSPLLGLGNVGAPSRTTTRRP